MIVKSQQNRIELVTRPAQEQPGARQPLETAPPHISRTNQISMLSHMTAVSLNQGLRRMVCHVLSVPGAALPTVAVVGQLVTKVEGSSTPAPSVKRSLTTSFQTWPDNKTTQPRVSPPR